VAAIPHQVLINLLKINDILYKVREKLAKLLTLQIDIDITSQ
jgi:hypothetical protein